jgi:antitoxin YefM
MKVQKIVRREGAFMLAVNNTTLRENMKTYMDKITDDYETIIVTRKNNKNIVMLSEESYNNMMENIYVIGTKSNYDWLMESKAQLENGMVSGHELLEVEVDE